MTLSNTVLAYIEGRQSLQQALGITDDYIAQIRGRARYYLEQGMIDHALIMLDTLQCLSYDDPTPTQVAVSVLLEDKRFSEARARAEKYLSERADNQEVLLCLAQIHARSGNIEEAQQILLRHTT